MPYTALSSDRRFRGRFLLFLSSCVMTFMICFSMVSAFASRSSLMNGGALSLWPGVPFIGLLLSLALLPLWLSNFWHKHYGKVAAFWASIPLLSLCQDVGQAVGLQLLAQTLMQQYFPFLCLITTLFTISGGIHIKMRGKATPMVNMGFLAMGALLANMIGTTGAAVLLIRPLIALNKHRHYCTHVVIFFIFLVANIGGCLTPLGDPPLFLGFLLGVPFFWSIEHLFFPLLLVALPLLILFLAVDHYFFFHDPNIPDPIHEHGEARIIVWGKRNILLLPLVMGVLLLPTYVSMPVWKVSQLHIPLMEVTRDFILLGLALTSWLMTPAKVHEAHHFSWEPLLEVTKIFAAIFITLLPVEIMLDAGNQGPLAPLTTLANPGGCPDNFLYFWLTGVLSGFLDNAPTYLVFFHMAGGKADILLRDLPLTLVAISSGAVFMGALTYIGNAPNFMVKVIASHAGIKMPSFIGYMAWSFAILLPLFFLLSWILF